jgi:hypothetical protein
MPGTDFSVHGVNPIAQGPAPAAAKAQSEGFSFGDFLDIINPLQHIPVISTLYRHLTGDEIGVPEKIAGDGLYGGVIGLACSLGDALFQEITGKNVGDTVYAFVTGQDDKAAAPTGIATGPVSVTPASSLGLTMPDLTGLFDSDATGPPAPLNPAAIQRATAAYQAAGRLPN